MCADELNSMYQVYIFHYTYSIIELNPSMVIEWITIFHLPNRVPIVEQFVVWLDYRIQWKTYTEDFPH